MREQTLQPGHILSGALFNGPDVWDVGLVGVQSDRFRRVTLTAQELTALTILRDRVSILALEVA